MYKLISTLKPFRVLLLTAFLSSCAVIGASQVGLLNDLHGLSDVENRPAIKTASSNDIFHDQIKPILDKRCVVCHACYDASCQLKLSSSAGIVRGASDELVYDIRLLTGDTSRLFVDAQSPAEWRDKGFFPVLNERDQTPQANLQSSVLFQMLDLKTKHPLTVGADQPLPASDFEFGLDRDQQCTTIEKFPNYARNFPQGGMPYALPALNQSETATLTEWLANGARMSNQPIPSEHLSSIEEWEVFFNDDSLKQQLTSRYIYEHLFLAHIYFDKLPGQAYYKLVRSSTPPGEPISQIPTRLPFHDPEVERVYYRLWHDPSTIVSKSHLPYAFNPQRMAWLKRLFIDEPYEVTKMPDYKNSVASNPFIAFEAIPVRSRYRFMLEEARHTIMGFIKGPVCRGQVALNVIQDHFWVMFVNPDYQNTPMIDSFLMEQGHNLDLPAGASGGYSSLTNIWLSYADKNREYLTQKMQVMENSTRPNNKELTLNYIWAGDGNNKNAALTIFRHFNSASVVHGLIGEAPKTAWLINYPLLERIHYLLVAEFDVYGNAGHQLATRLYMDFLRQEGEQAFLTLLPIEERDKLYKFWYRNASKAISDHMKKSSQMMGMVSGLDLRTNKPQQEVYDLLRAYLLHVLEDKYELTHPEVPESHRNILKNIEGLSGNQIVNFPEITLLSIDDANGQTYLYTILRNLAHSNISSLFSEEAYRIPSEDYLTVVRGVIGDYPGVMWNVNSSDLDAFKTSIKNLTTDTDYSQFMTRFGVRRSHPDFWKHSDKILSKYAEMEPVEAGILDYNRLENR